MKSGYPHLVKTSLSPYVHFLFERLPLTPSVRTSSMADPYVMIKQFVSKRIFSKLNVNQCHDHGFSLYIIITMTSFIDKEQPITMREMQRRN